MSSPMRITSGFTQDAPFQPLAQIGQPNPMFYATFFDEFIGYLSGKYTETNTGNGSVGQTAGAFGRALFTTNSSTPAATDISSMQIDAAAFTVASTYKFAYACRFQVADATNCAFNAGIIQTTTTPFTVTDGIYFGKASGSTAITLYVVSGSTVTGSVAMNYTPANATDFDLAFLYDGKGNVEAWAGAGLIGRVTNQNTASIGYNSKVTPTSFPTAVLNPTVALQSGTAASTTLNLDFLYAARER